MLLAGLAPLDWPGAFDRMLDSKAQELRLASAGEAELRERLVGSAIEFPPEDIAIIAADRALDRMLRASAREALRQGIAGWLSDDLAFVQPWSGLLSAVEVPVSIWHGERDTLVPLKHGELLARTLRNAVLFRRANASHVSMFACEPEALAASVSVPESSPRGAR